MDKLSFLELMTYVILKYFTNYLLNDDMSDKEIYKYTTAFMCGLILPFIYR